MNKASEHSCGSRLAHGYLDVHTDVRTLLARGRKLRSERAQAVIHGCPNRSERKLRVIRGRPPSWAQKSTRKWRGPRELDRARADGATGRALARLTNVLAHYKCTPPCPLCMACCREGSFREQKTGTGEIKSLCVAAASSAHLLKMPKAYRTGRMTMSTSWSWTQALPSLLLSPRAQELALCQWGGQAPARGRGSHTLG